QPSHSTHAVEECLGEGRTPEQVVVEKIEVASRKALDLRECALDWLDVVLFPAFEEGNFVAEVAYMRTAARDDDRVRDEIFVTLDQIAADRRRTKEGPLLREVARTWPTAPQISEELRPCVIAWSEKDSVRVGFGFLGQRGNVETAERDTDAARAIPVSDLVGATGGRDVDLDYDEVRLIIERDLLNMLVPDRHLVVNR